VVNRSDHIVPAGRGPWSPSTEAPAPAVDLPSDVAAPRPYSSDGDKAYPSPTFAMSGAESPLPLSSAARHESEGDAPARASRRLVCTCAEAGGPPLPGPSRSLAPATILARDRVRERKERICFVDFARHYRCHTITPRTCNHVTSCCLLLLLLDGFCSALSLFSESAAGYGIAHCQLPFERKQTGDPSATSKLATATRCWVFFDK
jgi:hypothetical protein